MNSKRRFHWIVLFALSVLLITGCGDSDDDGAAATATVTSAQQTAAVTHYANLVHTSYVQTTERAVALKAAVDAFAANPSADTLEAAKAAWNEVRELYGQTEGYRFYGGPIDDEDGPEGQLNAWPLDENYIDYTQADASSMRMMTGIINDTASFPMITTAVITENNEKDGEKNISAGFHAIEFLLWGQDFNADGPGNRPYTDFITGSDATAENGDRRLQYLQMATDQLVADLQGLVSEWDPNGGANFYASFTTADSTESLRRTFQGIGTLAGAELSQERAFAAYTEQDQEEEHSCFSDTTHVDMIANALSIQNVYMGRFGTFADSSAFVSTTDQSLYALVATVNPTLADKTRDDIQAAVDAARAIPVPFDKTIQDATDRATVLDFVTKLETATQSIVQSASALGIDNLNTELAE